MSPVLFAVSACWLGVGFLALATPGSTRRSASPTPLLGAARFGHALGLGALVVAAVPLSVELGCALALVTCLLATMAAASLAVLLLPLWPRFYLASVCSSGAITLVAGFL